MLSLAQGQHPQVVRGGGWREPQPQEGALGLSWREEVWGEGEVLAATRGNWPGLLGAWCGCLGGPQKQSPHPTAASASVHGPHL